MTTSSTKERVRFPIGWKLMMMMAFMLAAGMTSVVFLATNAYLRDSLAFIQKSQADSSRQMASQVEDQLRSLNKHLIRVAKGEGRDAAQIFAVLPEMEAFAVWSPKSTKPIKFKTPSGSKLTYQEITPDSKSFSGQASVRKVLRSDRNQFVISMPVEQTTKGEITLVGTAMVEAENLLSIFRKQGVLVSYLVSAQGELLAHPDRELLKSAKSFADDGVVKAMFGSEIQNGLGEFTQNNEVYLGAYKKIPGWDMGVVTLVSKDMATATVRRVKAQAFWVTGIILFLSLSIIYFFSTTLTNPIRNLVRLSRRIAEGQFDLDIQSKGNDEIALLTNSFGEMSQGLAERERIKGLFSKFHSKEIAEKILREELSLGGSRHDATVLFCDIRNFTRTSESATPAQVVEMLNEYFGVLVKEIFENKGVVDKFIGDAIMAVWGAPLANPDHAFDAVQGALAMRKALKDLNQKRRDRGEAEIQIGIGIHSGDLIAGNIGSVDRMEHTVIGDTVNTASRLEGVTKELGTDLIVSEEVVKRCHGRLLTKSFDKTELKGKSGSIKVFGVIGFVDTTGTEILL